MEEQPSASKSVPSGLKERADALEERTCVLEVKDLILKRSAPQAKRSITSISNRYTQKTHLTRPSFKNIPAPICYKYLLLSAIKSL